MSEVTMWLVNSLILAAVVTAAAGALDLALRWTGRPTRWAWLAAAAGSVTLPWLLPMLPGRVIPRAVADGIPMLALDPLTVNASADVSSQAGMAAPEIALTLWAVASLLMVAYVVRTVLQLARAQRGWSETELDGDRVYVTRDTGPAALGVRRGVVVVPSWALELRAEVRSLLLLHEREHVRAGDPRMLVTGLLLVAAMPWNPLVWFQLVRLRNAIELDCDARVLRRGADPRSYGALLLEVGRRRGSPSLVMAAFAEPRIFLHDRISRIAKWPAERRPARAVAAGAVALALFATALNARSPLASAMPDIAADTPAATSEVASSEAAGPVAVDIPDLVMFADTPLVPRYVPRTVEPELTNRMDVQRALVASYPKMLRDAGIGGTATVWFLIDEAGEVAAIQLGTTSGYDRLDEAALAVADVMRFSPAMNRTEPVAVWVEIPIRFNASSSSARSREVTVAGRPAAGTERRAGSAATIEAAGRAAEARRAIATMPPGERPPTTPMTVYPELTNRADVQRALVREYPAMLRDAGIGGSPTVWVYIDQSGTVRQTYIGAPSGFDPLDEAALSVAQMMTFSPAMNGDEVVSVWIEIPIRFSAR